MILSIDIVACIISILCLFFYSFTENLIYIMHGRNINYLLINTWSLDIEYIHFYVQLTLISIAVYN